MPSIGIARMDDGSLGVLIGESLHFRFFRDGVQIGEIVGEDEQYYDIEERYTLPYSGFLKLLDWITEEHPEKVADIAEFREKARQHAIEELLEDVGGR